jgi:hypothetical protein
MLPRLDHKPLDRFLAECLARFEPMVSLDEDEAVTVGTNQDGGPQTILQNALGELVHGRPIERPAPVSRHVYVGDPKGLALHQHVPACLSELWATVPTVSHDAIRTKLVGRFGARNIVWDRAIRHGSLRFADHSGIE